LKCTQCGKFFAAVLTLLVVTFIRINLKARFPASALPAPVRCRSCKYRSLDQGKKTIANDNVVRDISFNRFNGTLDSDSLGTLTNMFYL
jgi:hypothetical protein